MTRERPLQGACNCGRNRYLILVPENATEKAQVFFDVSSENRRSQAAPLTAWLRVPISWYQSHTRSYYPDETHSIIRRTFTPHHTPHCKRNFCGFCGTHLTYWSEQPASESDYLQVTLWSLLGDDIRALEDLGLLPHDTKIDALQQGNEAADMRTNQTVASKSDDNMGVERHDTSGNLSWFEEMISESALGRIRRTRREVAMSANSTARVEWEVMDIGAGDEESDSGIGRGKRKIGDVGGHDDAMKE